MILCKRDKKMHVSCNVYTKNLEIELASAKTTTSKYIPSWCLLNPWFLEKWTL